MDRKITREYTVRVSHRGKKISQNIWASDWRIARNKARAVIAERDYDAAFDGIYSVFLGSNRVGD